MTEKVHALYSIVERRMWNDERFRALSAPEPNARDLWIYLMTSPHLGVLPGLLLAGEGTIADDLEWPVEAVRACFAELETQEMVVADWRARVVVLPKVLSRSFERKKPEYPNVIKSWRRQWLEVPDCDLKRAYYATLRDLVDTLSPTFREAFAESVQDPFAKPLRKPFGNPLPNPLPNPFAKPFAFPLRNQDQDQDQDQDQEQDPEHTHFAGVGAHEGQPEPPPAHPTKPLPVHGAPLARPALGVPPDDHRAVAPAADAATGRPAPPPVEAVAPEPAPSPASAPSVGAPVTNRGPLATPAGPEADRRVGADPRALELLAELGRHPSLAAAATLAHAEALLGIADASAKPVALALVGIVEAAGKAALEAANGDALAPSRLGDLLRQYVRRARPAATDAAQTGPSNVRAFAPRRANTCQPWDPTPEEYARSKGMQAKRDLESIARATAVRAKAGGDIDHEPRDF